MDCAVLFMLVINPCTGAHDYNWLHTVDGCKILHQPRDGWTYWKLKPSTNWSGEIVIIHSLGEFSWNISHHSMLLENREVEVSNWSRTGAGFLSFIVWLSTFTNQVPGLILQSLRHCFAYCLSRSIDDKTRPVSTWVPDEHMGVSINGGTPKWLVYKGNS